MVQSKMVPRSVEELARLGVSVFDFVTAGAAVLLLFMACYFFTFKKTSSPTEDAVDYLKISLKLSNASVSLDTAGVANVAV